MIIGYTAFHNHVSDTPNIVKTLNEVILRESMVDLLHISVDINLPLRVTEENREQALVPRWTMRDLLIARFQGNLEGGTIGADDMEITNIQLDRRVYGESSWQPIGIFDYDSEWNMYTYNDRYIKNNTEYQYKFRPIAFETVGEGLESDTILTKFRGIFITDRNYNRRLTYDVEFEDITINQQKETLQPLNSTYPISIFGNAQYKSGRMSMLPLSNETINKFGVIIDEQAEQISRDTWIEWLANREAKVLRTGTDNILVTTSGIVLIPNESNIHALKHIAFDWTEIGKLNFQNMMKNALLPEVSMSEATFDYNGNLVQVR